MDQPVKCRHVNKKTAKKCTFNAKEGRNGFCGHHCRRVCTIFYHTAVILFILEFVLQKPTRQAVSGNELFSSVVPSFLCVEEESQVRFIHATDNLGNKPLCFQGISSWNGEFGESSLSGV